MAPDQKGTGESNPTRLAPKGFSAFSHAEESGLIRTLDGKEIKKEDQNWGQYQEGYNRMIEIYRKKLQNGTTRSGQQYSRIDYKKIWDPDTQSLPLEYRVSIDYEQREKFLKMFTVKTKYQSLISSSALEEIAMAKTENRLIKVDFSSEDSGKLQALVDLSFEALKSPDLSVEEGQILIRNTYLIIYITHEKMSQHYYDLFCQMEWPQKYGEHLKAAKEIQESLAKFTRELRKKYHLSFKYESRYLKKEPEKDRKEPQNQIIEETNSKDVHA